MRAVHIEPPAGFGVREGQACALLLCAEAPLRSARHDPEMQAPAARFIARRCAAEAGALQ